MAHGSHDAAAGSIRHLIEVQLLAVEQILSVSCELTRRLQSHTGEELADAAKAADVQVLADATKVLRQARTSADIPKGPTDAQGRGIFAKPDQSGDPQQTLAIPRVMLTGLAQNDGGRSCARDMAIERKKGQNKMVTPPDSPRAPVAEPLLGSQLNECGRINSWSKLEPRTRGRPPDLCSDETLGLAARSTTNPLEQRTKLKSGLFHDPQKMKEEMRAVIEAVEQEGVENDQHYHSTGCAQWLAKNDVFKSFTFLIICFSTLWLGVDADLNKPGASIQMKQIFFWVDMLITTYFTFEISVRYAAFRNKHDAFAAFSFNFDFALVAFMIFDSWVMQAVNALFQNDSSRAHHSLGVLRILRLFRLVRLARLGRLVRMVPDLVVLVNGLRMATRAVMSTIALLIIIIYVFSVLFVHLLQDTDEGAHCFSSVLGGMNCLLMQGIFVDQATLVYKMLKMHWMYYILILFYVALACLAVLNMLIGVVCEVVSSAARAESEARIMLSVRTKIMQAMHEADCGHKDVISLVEFKTVLENPSVVHLLHELDVDICALAEHGEFIFYKKDEMSFDDFMSEVVQFRSGSTCTTKDAVALRLFFLHELHLMEDRLQYALAGHQTWR